MLIDDDDERVYRCCGVRSDDDEDDDDDAHTINGSNNRQSRWRSRFQWCNNPTMRAQFVAYLYQCNGAVAIAGLDMPVVCRRIIADDDAKTL